MYTSRSRAWGLGQTPSAAPTISDAECSARVNQVCDPLKSNATRVYQLDAYDKCMAEGNDACLHRNEPLLASVASGLPAGLGALAAAGLGMYLAVKHEEKSRPL